MKLFMKQVLFLSTALVLLFLIGCSSSDSGGSFSSSNSANLSISNGVVSSTAAIVTGGSTVTIEQGTLLSDANGSPLSGTSAQVTVSYANNQNYLSGAAANIPSGTSLAGYLDIVISNGTQTVKALSKPISLALNVSEAGLKSGDSIALFSFNGTSWSSIEGTAIVDGSNAIVFNASHLSIWGAFKPSSSLFVSTDFLTDIANLTKAYIPPLFYTNLPVANCTQATVQDAKKSLERLQSVWADFKGKYKSRQEFTAYSSKFDEIDAEIITANDVIQKAIASGAASNDLLAAHEALEVIRVNLQIMDQKNGFYYLIDAIKDFHDAMEPFALAVKGKTAATLTDADLATLKGMFTIIDVTWNRYLNYKVNWSQFGVSSSVQTFVENAVAGQTKNLTALKAALYAATPDKSVIATNGNNIKPLFLKLFFSFADFVKPFDAELTALDLAASSTLTAVSKTSASSADVAAALTSVTNFENSWNKFKSHYATAPISIMSVLGWYTGSSTSPSYFDKIGTAIGSAKTQLSAIQSYPADLTQVQALIQVYAVEINKLKTQINYK